MGHGSGEIIEVEKFDLVLKVDNLISTNLNSVGNTCSSFFPISISLGVCYLQNQLLEV